MSNRKMQNLYIETGENLCLQWVKYRALRYNTKRIKIFVSHIAEKEVVFIIYKEI